VRVLVDCIKLAVPVEIDLCVLARKERLLLLLDDLVVREEVSDSMKLLSYVDSEFSITAVSTTKSIFARE